jgi:hypothetical protein
MSILFKKNKITQEVYDKTLEFFSNNNFVENNSVKNDQNGLPTVMVRKKKSYKTNNLISLFIKYRNSTIKQEEY